MGGKRCKFSLKLANKSIKIYIDGLLHLSIKQSELLSIQSWVNGNGENRQYHIMYTLKNGVEVESDYNDRIKWESILKLLDEAKIN